MSRDELLKRLSKFRTVPGHGPNLEEKTDEELELFVGLLEAMAERGSETKRRGSEEGE